MKQILVNSYFTGAGPCDLGLKQAGLHLQQSFELDRSCCDTLRANFDHEVIEGDITAKVVERDKDCHVMMATHPFCGGDRAAYKQIGNGVSVPAARWLGTELKRYFNQRRAA